MHVSPLQIEAQANEHEALKVDGFPGIFLYPSGKDQTPIPYAGYDRSLKVQKHARAETLPSACAAARHAISSPGCSMRALHYLVSYHVPASAAARPLQALTAFLKENAKKAVSFSKDEEAAQEAEDKVLPCCPLHCFVDNLP